MGREREREIFLICWFTIQKASATRIGPGPNQDPEIPSRLPIKVTETSILGPSSTVFSGTLAGRLMKKQSSQDLNWHLYGMLALQTLASYSTLPHQSL